MLTVLVHTNSEHSKERFHGMRFILRRIILNDIVYLVIFQNTVLPYRLTN